MKKFLLYYFIFLIFACISTPTSAEEKQIEGIKIQKKKIIPISVERREPLARVVCQSVNGTTFFDWMKVEYAVRGMQVEIEKLRDQGRHINIYLQYTNCSVIY